MQNRKIEKDQDKQTDSKDEQAIVIRKPLVTADYVATSAETLMKMNSNYRRGQSILNRKITALYEHLLCTGIYLQEMQNQNSQLRLLMSMESMANLIIKKISELQRSGVTLKGFELCMIDHFMKEIMKEQQTVERVVQDPSYLVEPKSSITSIEEFDEDFDFDDYDNDFRF